MTLYKKSFGQLGEKLAENYLKSNAFRILSRNFRTKFGEIDLVAEKEAKIHFVEVKTRTSTLKGKPYEAVNLRKVQHLKSAAHIYITNNKLTGRKYSVDVISIIVNNMGKVEELKYFENLDF